MTPQKTFFCILLFCLLVCSTVFTDSFLLVDEEDLRLSLSLRIALSGDYDFIDNKQEISIYSAEMSLKGELYSSLSCKLTIESEDADKDYALVISDIYLQYDFHEYINLRAGLFKIPFGAETFYSLGKRPYAGKTRTSDEIPPGRDIGLMCSGNNILGLFGYDLGIFLGTAPDLPEDAESNYLAAGKTFIEYKGLSLFDFQLGYNIYYHHFFLDVAQHQLGQGFFGTINVSFDKKNRLFLLAEYQERLKTRNVINPNMDWQRGFFIITTYRYNHIEPFIVLEWYDHSLLMTDEKELFLLKTGTAGYFLKDDQLKIKLIYELEYPYHSENKSHKITALLQMDI